MLQVLLSNIYRRDVIYRRLELLHVLNHRGKKWPPFLIMSVTFFGQRGNLYKLLKANSVNRLRHLNDLLNHCK